MNILEQRKENKIIESKYRERSKNNLIQIAELMPFIERLALIKLKNNFLKNNEKIAEHMTNHKADDKIPPSILKTYRKNLEIEKLFDSYGLTEVLEFKTVEIGNNGYDKVIKRGKSTSDVLEKYSDIFNSNLLSASMLMFFTGIIKVKDLSSNEKDKEYLDFIPNYKKYVIFKKNDCLKTRFYVKKMIDLYLEKKDINNIYSDKKELLLFERDVFRLEKIEEKFLKQYDNYFNKKASDIVFKGKGLDLEYEDTKMIVLIGFLKALYSFSLDSDVGFQTYIETCISNFSKTFLDNSYKKIKMKDGTFAFLDSNHQKKYTTLGYQEGKETVELEDKLYTEEFMISIKKLIKNEFFYLDEKTIHSFLDNEIFHNVLGVKKKISTKITQSEKNNIAKRIKEHYNDKYK